MNRDNILYIILGLVAVVLIGITIGLQVIIMMNRSADTAAELNPETARTLTESIRSALQAATATPLPSPTPLVIPPTPTPIPPTPTTPPTAIPTVTTVPTTVPTAVTVANAAVPSASNAELSPVDRMFNALNLIASEDDATIANIISTQANAIGFFGYSFFRNNQGNLRAIRVQLDGGLAIEPSAESVSAGLYPFTRPLFIYATADSLQRPEVEAFVGCYLNRVNTEIGNIGYFPVGAAAFQTAVNTFNQHCQRCAQEETQPACSLDNVPPSNITAAGSSTVHPLTQRMADLFRADGFGGTIRVDSVGSSAGFRRLCITADADIANASRAIKESEVANCQTIGRTPISFPIGLDAITIVVSQQNTFVENITVEQLQRIFTDATTWADVNPQWPNEPIVRVIPGRDSGTLDFFIDTVFAAEGDASAVAIVPVNPTPVLPTPIPTPVPPTATPVTATADTSSQDVGTQDAVAENSNALILGITERGHNCALVTAAMAQILIDTQQLAVEQAQFDLPEQLFAALSAGDIDATFCYVDPDDRSLMRQHLGDIRQMGINYYTGDGFKLQIWANSQSKADMRDDLPCVYDLFEKVSLEDESLQNQSVPEWRQQNAAAIATWLDCPYGQQENN